MENTPLCKFCGKPMEHNWCGMDEYYSCNCKGQTHKTELEHEISSLKTQLYNKETELRKFLEDNMYNTKIRNLNNQIHELENQYHNSED